MGVVSLKGVASLLRQSKTLKTFSVELCHSGGLRASDAKDLSESLCYSNSLEIFKLQTNTSHLGWQRLGNYFGNSSCSLRDLQLCECNLLDADLGMLASAIGSNPKLEELYLSYHSNHSLMSVSDGGHPPAKTKKMLTINGIENNFLVTRAKIVLNHFSGPDMDTSQASVEDGAERFASCRFVGRGL